MGRPCTHTRTHTHKHRMHMVAGSRARAIVFHARANTAPAHNWWRCVFACVHDMRCKHYVSTHVASAVPCKNMEISTTLQSPSPLESIFLAVLLAKGHAAFAPLHVPIKCTQLLVHFVTFLCQTSTHGSCTDLSLPLQRR